MQHPRRWLGLGIGLVVAGLGAWVGYRALRDGPLRLSGAERAGLGRAAACITQRRAARPACYQTVLTAEVKQRGVAAAIAQLKALTAVDREANRDGHVYAHGIGIEGYLHYQSVPRIFGDCPVQFSSGCGHGVIQAYLQSQSTIDSATVNALCEPYRRAGEPISQLFQCVHGMGHGLNMMYGGDLPRALTTCDELEQGWDRVSCYGGAFMENIMGQIAPHHPASELAASHEHDHMNMETPAFKRLDPNDLLYPCSIMAEKYLQPCYEIQTAGILFFTKGDVARTGKACEGAPEGMRRICFLSLGRDITSKARRDPGRTRRLCNQGGELYRPWCYFGAVKALVEWESDPGAGLIFCDKLDGAHGSLFCYRGVGEELRNMLGAEAEREKACSGVQPVEAREACRYGAGLPGSRLSP